MSICSCAASRSDGRGPRDQRATTSAGACASRAEESGLDRARPRSPSRRSAIALEKEVDGRALDRPRSSSSRGIADENGGVVDLRPDDAGRADPEIRRLMIGRASKLERMGLAEPVGPAHGWSEPEPERSRCAISACAATSSRPCTGPSPSAGQRRGVADYVIDGETPATPIIGRLVDKGLHDELTGEAYAVIDGTDGRAHHVRFRGIEALSRRRLIGGDRRGAPLRRTEDTAADACRSPTVRTSTSSSQITAPGATWLDRQSGRARAEPLAMGGFRARGARSHAGRVPNISWRRARAAPGSARHLAARSAQHPATPRTGRRGPELSAETGLPHHEGRGRASTSSGVYRQRLTLASGRFAMIDDGLGFQLVPWSREIEQKLGQHVAGVARDGGGIEWSLGRKRDLGLVAHRFHDA